MRLLTDTEWSLKPLMAAPRHILHIIDDLSYGGAQQLLVAFADALPRDSYRMSVCALQPDCPLRGQLESRGIDVFCLNRERPGIRSPLSFCAYVYKNVRDIAGICRRRHIDVIHCHLSDAEYIGALVRLVYKAAAMYTTNHYPFLPEDRPKADPRNLARKTLYGFLYNRCMDRVIAVSTDVRRVLHGDYGVRQDKITVITNGINTAHYHNRHPSEHLRASLGLNGDETVISTIGRLYFQKGQTYVIDAVHRLTQQGYPVVLLLAGDGELRAQLEAQADTLGITSRIRFLGARPDTADILALTDLFVFPSLYEGTSLALLEAMAAGKPIIATAIPGNMEVITHQENGCLVPPEDASTLADAAAHLIDHPERAAELGRRAYQTVQQRFDIRHTITAHEKLWDCLGT